MVRRSQIYIAVLLVGCAAVVAGAEQNVFNSQIDARAGMRAGGDINVPTATIYGKKGILYALEVRQATEPGAVKIGEPGVGELQIYVQRFEGETQSYAVVIESSTSLPLILNGFNEQVRIIGGAEIRGGTTHADQLLEVTNGPIRIIGATDSLQAYQLVRSATDSTGMKAYIDPVSRTINLVNDQGGGWYFDPALSNSGASPALTVYANSIVMDSTDPTTLVNYINTTMYNLSWDRLLNSASATTIIGYVSAATTWVMNHFEQVYDSTGERAIDYIERRITERMLGIENLTVTGALYATYIDSISMTVNNLYASDGLYATGTIQFGTPSTFIGFPTQEIDLEPIQAQIDVQNAVLTILYNWYISEGSSSGIQSGSQVIGDGSNTIYIIDHNLDKVNVVIQAEEATERKRKIFPEYQILDASAFAVIFADPPNVNQIRVSWIAY